MKVALAQLNFTIGHFDSNADKIIASINRAKAEGARLVVFSELSVCGYPPHDLLTHKHFVDKSIATVNQIAQYCNGIYAIVGAPSINTDTTGKLLFNSAYLLGEGKVLDAYHKTLLPDYDIFDEYRYFEPNPGNYRVAEIDGIKIAITICEDIWDDQPTTTAFSRSKLYRDAPMNHLVKLNPDMVINISASPFSYNVEERRLQVFQSNVARYSKPVIYVNQVGGNTDLLFDGGSMVVNAGGDIIEKLKSFEEDFRVIDTNVLERNQSIPPEISATSDQRIERIHNALVMGIRDYFGKLGFTKATLGLSGGIDSAVVLALAAQALDVNNIRVLLMPSQYSSQHSIDDAVELAQKLGVQYDIVSIQPIFESFKNQLSSIFEGRPEDITEENIQARVRGTLLMAISNKFGHLLLNTSNKSEAAVGYGTLYGDMCGALSVLGDVYKTDVYRLANYINRNDEIIPINTIQKPPSAELRPNQKDSDSLPPYEILDPILFAYIEQGLSAEEIVGLGFPSDTVNRTLRLVNMNEYKRYQSPPILRVSSKAFGYGRKMPLVTKWS
ncbi:NAD+ synthase [Tenuifilum sp.]|uniref:NAD+ synthase n=1 Tax=Tenuifilum sp. TaxID=2760880 RepID=UPI002D1D867F|nr:NAD+ synthase [Tenuifilum sp.]HQE53690.1 NAD+ synthase [Tenuifilum sp.]HQG71509.1 NAD+ synthase [Tenuifilum sp.]HQI88353.1 NAD+ synthase [Tenuifilum sp.]